MALQVLLVEDDPGDLKGFTKDLPPIFKQNRTEVTLHPCGDFADALTLASDPLRRYDLIISDTYRGPTKNGDADVLKMVKSYRGLKFCPLVVYSSGVKPATLIASPFVIWADKSKAGDIDRAITQVLKSGVPQIARKLHEELESSAASFLWPFLEQNWDAISKAGKSDPDLVERLIRRRAAIQMGDLHHDGATFVPVLSRLGSEYYVYPKLPRAYYSLGDVLRHKQNKGDFRVVLTPHCHLFMHPGQQNPRADYVLTIKTVKATDVLGEKIANAKKAEKEAKYKKLGGWTRSPAQTDRTPEGRHWYLPAFLEIPHLYADLLQMESIPYGQVAKDFDGIATLVSPYAEALQACFVSFYGSVGIPDLKVESIEDLLD
ncbi:MAG TPA: hypothetical protein VE377_13990 [Candidatus Dormibacteraeota bacterium]|nr:hypothetical protein [Candidatus Dormibacteraeota bacterium]